MPTPKRDALQRIARRAYAPFTVRVDHELVGQVLAEKYRLARMPLDNGEVRRA